MEGEGGGWSNTTGHLSPFPVGEGGVGPAVASLVLRRAAAVAVALPPHARLAGETAAHSESPRQRNRPRPVGTGLSAVLPANQKRLIVLASWTEGGTPPLSSPKDPPSCPRQQLGDTRGGGRGGGCFTEGGACAGQTQRTPPHDGPLVGPHAKQGRRRSGEAEGEEGREECCCLVLRFIGRTRDGLRDARGRDRSSFQSFRNQRLLLFDVRPLASRLLSGGVMATPEPGINGLPKVVLKEGSSSAEVGRSGGRGVRGPGSVYVPRHASGGNTAMLVFLDSWRAKY